MFKVCYITKIALDGKRPILRLHTANGLEIPYKMYVVMDLTINCVTIEDDMLGYVNQARGKPNNVPVNCWSAPDGPPGESLLCST